MDEETKAPQTPELTEGAKTALGIAVFTLCGLIIGLIIGLSGASVLGGVILAIAAIFIVYKLVTGEWQADSSIKPSLRHLGDMARAGVKGFEPFKHYHD